MSDPYFAQDDEFGLIGACLSGGSDVCHEVFAKIPTEALQDDNLRHVFEITKGLVAKSDPVNMATVVKEWKRSMGQTPVPFEALNKCDEMCPSPANYPAFAQAVLEAHHRRHLRTAGDRLIRDSAVSTLSVDQIVANAEAGLTVEASKEEVQPCKSVVSRFIDSTQERFARKGHLSGITSGFRRLDAMTDGFQFGELAIIAARPSIDRKSVV